MTQKQAENKIDKYVSKFLKDRPDFGSPIINGPNDDKYITNGHFMVNVRAVSTLTGLFNKEVNSRANCAMHFACGKEVVPVCIRKFDFTMPKSTELVEFKVDGDKTECYQPPAHINRDYFDLMVSLGAEKFFLTTDCKAVEFVDHNHEPIGYCMSAKWGY